MVNPIRRAMERLYGDTCTIYEIQHVKDDATGITHKEGWAAVAENLPCRLSSKSVVQTQSVDGLGQITKVVKLYLAPEITVKAGSKIVVSRRGRTEVYQNSGEPTTRTNHQEIALAYHGEA